MIQNTQTPSPSGNPELLALDQQIAELQEQRRQLLILGYPELTVRTDANINPKQYWPDIKHIIQYAFSIGENHFFQFHDLQNIPFERGLSTIVFYQELEMNCTREFLAAATIATLNCLKAKVDEDGDMTIQVSEAKDIQRVVVSRINMPRATELMYNFAAVVFFDQYENPLTFETSYNKEKIKFWKQVVGLRDFFSQTPMKDLLPFIDSASENLEAYAKMVENETTSQLALLRKHLSSEQAKKWIP